MKPIAVSGAERFAALPNVPTVRESGLDFDNETWIGYFVRAGTPAPIVARLRADFDKVLAMPEIAAGPGEARLPHGAPVARKDTEALVARDIDKWTQLIRSAGIRASPTEASTRAGIKHRRASAASAGLRYVTDDASGITRKRVGAGWAYYAARRPAHHATGASASGINSLAIPPAWTDVWICPDPDGHIQATGARRARPQAVPLPPGVPRGARPTPSSATCSSSARCCRCCASASSATCARPTIRAGSSSPRWCGCSTAR